MARPKCDKPLLFFLSKRQGLTLYGDLHREFACLTQHYNRKTTHMHTQTHTICSPIHTNIIRSPISGLYLPIYKYVNNPQNNSEMKICENMKLTC